MRARGPLFEPGTRREYSNAGFTVLARVVEVVEDRPFGAVLAERVFPSAGMASALDETGQRLMPRRAMQYRLGADDERLVVKRAPYENLRFLTGAGSVHARARDLLRFVRAIRAGTFGDDLAEDALRGDAAAVPLPPPVVEPGEVPTTLVGTYGPAEITLVDGRLFRGDNEFYPIEGRRYYIAASGTVIRFRRDSAGAVDAVVSIGGGGRASILPRSASEETLP